MLKESYLQVTIGFKITLLVCIVEAGHRIRKPMRYTKLSPQQDQQIPAMQDIFPYVNSKNHSENRGCTFRLNYETRLCHQ
jgi:hypothetical protein